MPYRKSYMTSHDIDWYACINGRWILASSMGGVLPGKTNDDRFLPLLQTVCYNLPDLVDKEEIVINDGLIEERYERAKRIYREFYVDNEQLLNQFIESFTYDNFKESYSAEFVEMARKGFITFIRSNIDNINDNTYSLVAKPPEDISDQLSNILLSPLPAWMDNPLYRSYLNEISYNSANINEQILGISLWGYFE